ncbi:BHLH domain-containing protein [Psidium guajava]|nr:BHLH domain-containing protein [Psidium guajava]
MPIKLIQKPEPAESAMLSAIPNPVASANEVDTDGRSFFFLLLLSKTITELMTIITTLIHHGLLFSYKGRALSTKDAMGSAARARVTVKAMDEISNPISLNLNPSFKLSKTRSIQFSDFEVAPWAFSTSARGSAGSRTLLHIRQLRDGLRTSRAADTAVAPSCEGGRVRVEVAHVGEEAVGREADRHLGSRATRRVNGDTEPP